MTYKFMTDPSTGNCALFLENGTSGGFDDPAATRNAPLRSPSSWLANLKFHTACDHMEVAFSGQTNVTHNQVNGIAVPSGLASAYGVDAGSQTLQLIFAHNLGYIPYCLVVIGNNVVWPGMPIQSDGVGGNRFATISVGMSNLFVNTFSTIGPNNLPAITPTYKFLIFKKPPAAAGNVLFDFNPSTGVVSMGRGKFSSDKAYLQVVSGGTPFGLMNDRSIDVGNGAPKAWNPDGTTKQVVPSGVSSYLQTQAYGNTYTPTTGASMGYSGSYAGPTTSLQVQAP